MINLIISDIVLIIKKIAINLIKYSVILMTKKGIVDFLR